MPQVDASHNQFLIDTFIRMVDASQKQLLTVPPERIPIVHYGIGTDGVCVAVGYLMQGNLEEARAWFKKSAENFCEYSVDDNVGSEMRALECATLCGDRDFRAWVADKIKPRSGRHLPLAYPYVMFVKFTIQGDEEKTTRFAQEMAAVNPDTLKKRGWYGSIGPLCLGLASRDPQSFKTALDSMVHEHKLKCAHGWKKLPQGLLCFPGATLLTLARQAGMEIDIKTPYIPDAMIS